mmetsp:Transcript_21194/g.63778  ORF Transcript_21194/g.63778 Transcript_21194/m.63778 type:complete len:112 (-) Transcript_21194:523-858(-)
MQIRLRYDLCLGLKSQQVAFTLHSRVYSSLDGCQHKGTYMSNDLAVSPDVADNTLAPTTSPTAEAAARRSLLGKRGSKGGSKGGGKRGGKGGSRGGSPGRGGQTSPARSQA